MGSFHGCFSSGWFIDRVTHDSLASCIHPRGIVGFLLGLWSISCAQDGMIGGAESVMPRSSRESSDNVQIRQHNGPLCGIDAMERAVARRTRSCICRCTRVHTRVFRGTRLDVFAAVTEDPRPVKLKSTTFNGAISIHQPAGLFSVWLALLILPFPRCKTGD